MLKFNWIAALALCIGLNAFAEAPKGLVQTVKPALRSGEARDHTVDFPQGYYVNEDGDLSLRITKTGMLRTEFGIVMTNGTKAPFDFPRKLRYIESEDVYRTKGEIALFWLTNLGYLTCRYPVTAEVEDLGKGESIRVHFALPAQMYLDVYGRCVSYGTNHKTARFNRE